MHWLWVIIIGLIVGIIAKFFDRDHAPVGWILTIIIGIVGSILATFVFNALHVSTGHHILHFIASIIGAIILLAIYTAIKRGKGGGGARSGA